MRFGVIRRQNESLKSISSVIPKSKQISTYSLYNETSETVSNEDNRTACSLCIASAYLNGYILAFAPGQGRAKMQYPVMCRSRLDLYTEPPGHRKLKP